MQGEDARTSFAARGPIAAQGSDSYEFAAQPEQPQTRDLQLPATPVEPFEVILQEPDAAAVYAHGFENTVAILQSAVAIVDPRASAAIDPGAQGRLASARSSPSALARVSANSCAGFESATIPAPARNLNRPPCEVMVRIKILRSQLPSRFK